MDSLHHPTSSLVVLPELMFWKCKDIQHPVAFTQMTRPMLKDLVTVVLVVHMYVHSKSSSTQLTYELFLVFSLPSQFPVDVVRSEYVRTLCDQSQESKSEVTFKQCFLSKLPVV